MAVLLTAIVFLGFGSTYGRQLVLGQDISGSGIVEADGVIHLHAAVFVGWMAFLLAQTVLVATGRTRVHMALGTYGGMALGIAVLVVGGLITYVQIQAAVAKGFATWAEWPIHLMATMISWFSLLAFAALLGLGYRARRRPPAHKRYMVFATIILVVAATSRMEYLLGPWSNTIGIGIMVSPLIAYDLYTERRVRPATLIGTGLVGVGLVIMYLT
ncbi:MAG: hypothetical protein GVY35_01335 [Bacteroidetes bacterium]|jgi:hypothetical protein|nr:hypothetical protein [Bacteroidota bacterium]